MSGKPVSIKSLADLKQVKRAIEEQVKKDAQQAQTRIKAAKQQTSERDLFVRAAGPVQRLPDKGHAVQGKKRAPPAVMQRELDADVDLTAPCKFGPNVAMGILSAIACCTEVASAGQFVVRMAKLPDACSCNGPPGRTPEPSCPICRTPPGCRTGCVWSSWA